VLSIRERTCEWATPNDRGIRGEESQSPRSERRKAPGWALDGDVVDAGGLGIRTATDSDRDAASGQGVILEPGSLVIADRTAAHALLFDQPLPGRGLRSRTKRVTLFTVGVDGVPDIHIDEALWICAELLG